NLHLGSSVANIVLGSNLMQGAKTVNINVAGLQTAFQAGQHVTAAQYVAINQILSGQYQSLKINHRGAATGGNFSLNLVSPTAAFSELVVPRNVSALNLGLNSSSSL